MYIKQNLVKILASSKIKTEANEIPNGQRTLTTLLYKKSKCIITKLSKN